MNKLDQKPLPTKSQHGMEFEKGVIMSLITMLNWKAPPRDQIANFWLKQLTVMQRY